MESDEGWWRLGLLVSQFSAASPRAKLLTVRHLLRPGPWQQIPLPGTGAASPAWASEGAVQAASVGDCAAEDLGLCVSQNGSNPLHVTSLLSWQGEGVRGLLTHKHLHLQRDGGLEHFEAAGQLSAYLSKTNRND